MFVKMILFVLVNVILLYLLKRRIILYNDSCCENEILHVCENKTSYFHKHKSSYNIILIINKIILYLQERSIFFHKREA